MTRKLDEYRAMLRVNKHRLDDELEVQAEYQEEISAHLAVLNTRVHHTKEEIARVEARLTQDLGAELKLTVAELAAKVRRHRDRVEAFREWQGAREEQEEWAGLLDAWRQRGHSMRELGNLYTGQYFAVNSAGGYRKGRDDYRPRSRSAPE